MIMWIARRLHREEQGYALVVAIILLSVMMVLLVVALDAGNAALDGSTKSIAWSRTLGIAEAGLDDAVTLLGQNRTAANPCSSAGSTTCPVSTGGEYQLNWVRTAGGGMVVTSTGYFPTKAAPRYTRQVQATYEPSPTFTYALFSQDSLEVKNDTLVVGDVYSTGNVTVGTRAIVCGSVVSANGSITMQNLSSVVKTHVPLQCSGKSGLAWAGGSITGANGVIVAGNAQASGPTTTTCSSTGTSYRINRSAGTWTVQGSATACGSISGITASGGSFPGTATTQPPVRTMPAFVFDPNNYTDLVCYPSGGTCSANTSSTAVANFQTYVNANKTNLKGTYAVWQTNPTQSTVINLDGVTSITGDLTIITNAPITFGNTSTIGTTVPSGVEMVVISLYQPPASTTCDVNGGDCSIYGQNAIQFSRGDVNDPNDGVVGLLYTTGKMAFKNQGVPGEGALYASSMDIKNGFDIVYNSRIERVLGFGVSLQRVLWQELNT